VFFFFQAEDGIRDVAVTGVQTCALPIWRPSSRVTFSRGVSWVTAISTGAWSAATGVAPSSAGDVPAGRCARRELRAGCSAAARSVWATSVWATGSGAAATGAADGGVEAPDWRPLIARTRSPLRILAVPVRPRLPA